LIFNLFGMEGRKDSGLAHLTPTDGL
jgi:hypothetical protein